MKKLLLVILSLLMLTSCGRGENDVEWYENGGFGADVIHECYPNGKFLIGDYSGTWMLEVNAESGELDTILKVTDYLLKDNKLYAFSNAGYGIVDEARNTARLLVFDSKANYDDYTDDSAVTYLTAYDEFSEEEKDVFSRMNAFWEGRDKREYNVEYIVDLDGEIRPYVYSLDRQKIKEELEKESAYEKWLPWNNEYYIKVENFFADLLTKLLFD